MHKFKLIVSSAFSFICRYVWQPVAFMVLLVSGGYVFVYLESAQETAKVKCQGRVELLEDSLINSSNLTKYDLENYFKERQIAEKLQGALSLMDATALCMSIALTTGWGAIVPTTRESKIFFLFYSCISISITAIILKSVSDVIHQIIASFIHQFDLKILRRP